ncbi:MAG: ABC transporter permease [Acholeplasmatales bacterium]|nr:ABC transporter permease [Acholeplasmatales bacterium]
MESELNTIFGKNNFSLIDKDSDVSYSESRGEMDEGKTMGNFLPIIFIAIAVLTMITTMHRVTINEKIQIGTLKALGFKNRRILMHYTSYGLFIAGVGSIIGVFLGVLINYIVLNPNGMMGTYFDIDKWPYEIPLYVIFVSIAIIALLTLITYLSVRKMLKGTAAETLRPYVPKKHKQLLIEKTKHFEKLSFETRWNLRDVFRNKVRSLMTIVGVAGSTLLLIATLAFLSTFTNYLDVLENKSMKYETSIALNTEIDETNPIASMYLLNQTARENAEKVNGDYAAMSSVTIDDGTEYISLQVLNKSHDLYGVLDKKCNEIKLEDTGVYVSRRVVSENGVNKGDTIKINFISGETKLIYEVKVIGIITSFSSKCILASENYINSIKDTTNQMTLPYVISNIYTELSKTEVEALNLDGIVSMSTKSELMKTFDAFMSIFYIMIVLFVVFAVLLAIVVLYNLGVMSYFERYRQLATLKVVGFKDKYISKILISQNTWLTIVGIIIGIPLGIIVLYVLVELLTGDYELTIKFGWYSFVGTILGVYLASFLVSFFVSKKNKKIDMVEALKGIE